MGIGILTLMVYLPTYDFLRFVGACVSAKDDASWDEHFTQTKVSIAIHV